MNDTLRHMKTAFAWLRRIPVTDTAVDFMAMARQELNKAIAIEEAKEAEAQRKAAAKNANPGKEVTNG